VSVTPPVQPAGEVRVTEYVRRAARRWYVIVFAIVAAVLLVFLHGVSGATKQSAATASVYLGQPFTPSGSAVLNSTPLSNPSISIQYATAPQQLAAAAKAAGIDNRRLRSHISVLASGGAAASAGKAVTGTGPPTITITAEGPWTRLKVQTVANTLAQSLIDYANRYTTLKTNLIAGRVALERSQLHTVLEVQKQARANLATIARSSADPLSKVAAQAPFVTDLSTAADQIGTLTQNLTNDQVALAATKDIESAQFISRAVGHRVSATTRRNSLVIAAMVGLIIGTGLALAWEALSARPKREQA
jgi:hypothetical protein